MHNNINENFLYIFFFLKIINKANSHIIVAKNHHIFRQIKPAAQRNNKQIKDNAVKQQDGCKASQAKKDVKPWIRKMVDKNEQQDGSRRK